MEDSCDKMKWRVPDLRPWVVLLLLLAWIIVSRIIGSPHPPVGTFIGILAFVAAVVTIWPPHSSWAKAGWLLVFGGFLFSEISTLYQQQAAEAERRTEEDDRFAGLLKTQQHEFDKVLKQNEESLEKSLKRMEDLALIGRESIYQTTGGTSYPFADIYPMPDGSVGFPLILMVKGKYSLYDLSVSLQKVSNTLTFDDSYPSQRIGEVPPYGAWIQHGLHVEMPAQEQKDSEYGIIFRARNGMWAEFLHIRWTDKGPLGAYEVYGSNANAKNTSQPIMIQEFPR